LPVSVGGIIPSAGGGQGIHDDPFVEAGDEVGATDDIVRVEEPKRAFLGTGDKLHPVQPLCFPPGVVCAVDLEPANPEYVHAGRCGHAGVQSPDSVDSQDLCIHVWVGWVITRESDHVRAVLHVDLIGPSPQVVCCVVNCHYEPLLEAVAK